MAGKHQVTKIAYLAAPIDIEMLSQRPKLAFGRIAVGAVNVLETVRLLDIKRGVVQFYRNSALCRDMIPSADIEIRSGLSFVDTLEIHFRGVLDVKLVEEQLEYTVKYTDIRAGIAELVARCPDYLVSTGQMQVKIA